MDKLDEIKQKIEEIKAKSAVSGEMKQFITLVLSVIVKSKKEIENLSYENVQLLKDSIAYIEKNYESKEKILDTKINTAKGDFDANIATLKALIAKVKTIKPIDGVDGKDGIDGKDGNDGKDGSPDTGEQIVDKINELPITPENQIDASHIKNLPVSKSSGGGSTARNFYQLFDTPENYIGAGGKVVSVKSTEDGLEFTTGGSGSGDMTKAVYDPANGARQVAFSDEIPDVSSFITDAPSDGSTYGRKNASWVAVVGGSGISRSISSISTPTNAGAIAQTDYVYLITNTTLTLPTAVGNTNKYSLKCVSGTATISTTSSQTIDGSVGITLSVVNTSVDVVSDNFNWVII